MKNGNTEKNTMNILRMIDVHTTILCVLRRNILRSYSRKPLISTIKDMA